MDSTTRLTLNVFAPAAVALVLSLVLAAAGWNLGANPMLEGVADAWLHVVAGILLLSVLLAAHGGFRLWQWQRGRALDCPNCGGLLGRERDGRYGPYRRCLACSKNIARINYARNA